jgi:hypothetical protein
MAEAIIVLRDSDGVVDIEVKTFPEKDPNSEALKLVERFLQQAGMEKIGNESDTD